MAKFPSLWYLSDGYDVWGPGREFEDKEALKKEQEKADQASGGNVFYVSEAWAKERGLITESMSQ